MNGCNDFVYSNIRISGNLIYENLPQHTLVSGTVLCEHEQVSSFFNVINSMICIIVDRQHKERLFCEAVAVLCLFSLAAVFRCRSSQFFHYKLHLCTIKCLYSFLFSGRDAAQSEDKLQGA